MESNSSNEWQRPKDFNQDRDYFLKHFHYIADQRVKTIGFYLVLSGVLLGATATAFSNAAVPAQVRAALGALNVLVAWAFALLDRRNRRLLEYPRLALISLEQQYPVPWAKMFAREVLDRKRLRESPFDWRQPRTALEKLSGYSLVFTSIHLFHQTFGFFLLFYAWTA